jgi:hypothetical protein
LCLRDIADGGQFEADRVGTASAATRGSTTSTTTSGSRCTRCTCCKRAIQRRPDLLEGKASRRRLKLILTLLDTRDIPPLFRHRQ